MQSARRLPFLFVFLAAALLALVGACGRTDLAEGLGGDSGLDSGLPDGMPNGDGGLDASHDGPAILVSLAVTPPLVSLVVGTKAALVATGTYSDNTTADLTSSVTWTSNAANVATVSAGIVTAVAPGAAIITATLGNVSATAKVTVPSATIVSIAITPPSTTTAINGSVVFDAVATLSDSSHQDVTLSAIWGSSSPSVASVSSSGVAKGLGAGTTTITASVGNVTGKATLSVTSATLVSITISPTNPVVGTNVTFPFTATGTYSDNSVANLTSSATWTSSAPSTVSVSSTGVATTLAAGTSVISATVGNVTGVTAVTVTAATLVSIAVSPAQSTLAIAGSVQLKALGTFSDNTTFDLTQSATWSSSAPGVAQVSNAQGTQGLVTGLSAGGATITATLGNVGGSASVSVTAATLVSIAITPLNPTVPKGNVVAFTAKGTYSDSSVADLTTSVTWSTGNPAIATISNGGGTNGTATGVSAGTTGVTATLGNVAASTTITVTNATLVSIAVTPASSSLAIGLKESLVATGTYSDNSTFDLTATAAWSSNANGVATVSNVQGAQGQVAAVGPGTATVTATVGNVSGSATVSVTTPTLAQIVVTPINLTRPAGQKIQYQAMAIFTNNTSQNVTLQSAWTSSNPGAATIGATGLVSTNAQGTTTISATFQGMTGSTQLSVSSAVVVSITVTPLNPTYAAGTVQQFQAVAIFSDNTSQNVTGQATWLSTSPNVAGVSTNGGTRGRVTTLAAGTTQIEATWQGITGSSTVTVSQATIVGISVSPAQVTVVPGTYRQFTAQAIYSDNTSKDVTGQATWVSSAPSVAGVSDTNGTKGLALANATGSAQIKASYGGLTGSGTMNVSSATVVSIQVTPAQPSVAKGVPVKFSATAILSDNTSQDVTAQSTWTSSNTSVAPVSDTLGTKGLTQTLAAGTATISATFGGVTGTTVITVTNATLTTIQITPFSPTLPVGYATQLVATGIYSDNTTQDLTFLATWTSSAPNVASVSDSGGTKGRTTPLAQGSATISAAYQSVTGTDAVTVTSATLVSITIAPASSTIATLASQPFTATGQFSDNSTMDVTTYVTWLSSTPGIASISNAQGSQGIAKGLSSGSVTITAVRGNVSGTAQLTVQ